MKALLGNDIDYNKEKVANSVRMKIRPFHYIYYIRTPNRFLFKAQASKYEGPGRFVPGNAEDIRLIGDNGFMEFVKEKIKKCKHFLGTVQNMESD